MCRNIRTLHNFQPPATEEEIRAELGGLFEIDRISAFGRNVRQ